MNAAAPRAFDTTCILRDGTRQTLPVIARSTFDAIDIVSERFGLEARAVFARPRASTGACTTPAVAA
ncbi:MAG: hypothetical protein ABI433_09955 [Burkholderiaceae bacterium]